MLSIALFLEYSIEISEVLIFNHLHGFEYKFDYKIHKMLGQRYATLIIRTGQYTIIVL